MEGVARVKTLIYIGIKLALRSLFKLCKIVPIWIKTSLAAISTNTGASEELKEEPEEENRDKNSWIFCASGNEVINEKIGPYAKSVHNGVSMSAFPKFGLPFSYKCEE